MDSHVRRIFFLECSCSYSLGSPAPLPLLAVRPLVDLSTWVPDVHPLFRNATFDLWYTITSQDEGYHDGMMNEWLVACVLHYFAPAFSTYVIHHCANEI